MQTLDGFDFQRGPGRYDWTKMLDGQVWKVPTENMNMREGEDSMVTIIRFRRTAYAAAKSRGVVIQTQTVEGGLVLQAL